ncbi:MAG TPA: histidinol dehydrogenase, partial [Bacteroidia bacterium]
MGIIKYPKQEEWKNILARPVIDSSVIEEKVSVILKEVKQNGDSALKNYSLSFGDYWGDVTEKNIYASEKKISNELKSAILLAKKNIERFHFSQKEKIKIVETAKGVKCWRKSVAIEKVGLYIPGGSAPLFSTILMLGIPARIAGCKEIILCTPSRNGEINPAVLYAAKIVGIKKIFKVGGGQAIAAMAYGTETIPKVSKIFGPGNQYVTCAKQLVQKDGV